MVGHCLGHYRIEAQVGVGGMGIVYRAHDPNLQRTVAIKVLREGALADDDQRRRFTREARAASALNHPNIITVYDIDRVDGTDFMAMEFVLGVPLHQVVPSGGLELDRAFDYGVQLARALAAAHRHGIVHRDVKPANILVTDDCLLKVLDFGLAKLAEPAAEDSSTRSAWAGTEDALMFCGTPGYASPEQVEGRRADSRSDVFAAGAILFEMIAGRSTFQRSSIASTLAAVLHETPPSLRTIRREVPPDMERVVARCLEKDPDRRYPSASELLSDLEACQGRQAARRVPVGLLLRRPAVLGTVLVLSAALVTTGGWFWLQDSRARWARTVALPEAQRLIDQGKTYAGFRLLRQAEAYAAGDPFLQELLSEATIRVTVRTTPPGADVSVRDFFEDPNVWEPIGRSPINDVRVPTGTLVWRIAAKGFVTKEVPRDGLRRSTEFALQSEAGSPPEMVLVPAGPSGLFGSPPLQVNEYWIDKYEVTNRQFKAFVEQGGYEKREYWAEPLASNGVELSWAAVRQQFRDRTGQPGPAVWELGTYPDAKDGYPVGGVSWYEASAFCAAVGKQLPTVYHWYRAASLAAVVTGIARFGNFASSGADKVGHPLRMGAQGPYDMAGNVKEWSWNSADSTRRYILGGGWNEPSYMFRDQDAQRALDRQATFGFRCAKYPEPLAPSLLARVGARLRDYRLEIPVGDEVFAAYKSLYQYDASPLNATVESIDERFQHYRVELVSFAAAYGNERVTALLFLPKNVAPPYQTLVWMPGGNAFNERARLTTAAEGQADWFLFAVRSGRAVFFPVYKGTYERSVGPPLEKPNVWRDLMIDVSKDLRRGVDYLVTRPDIDARKLAYYGLSMGASVGPIMTALEPRFSASILLGGGLFAQRLPPESEAFNFLQRAKVPTLMINGRHDFLFRFETSQKPMFDLLGSPPSYKQHYIVESGHVPSERLEVIKEILTWLDRYLGRVKPS